MANSNRRSLADAVFRGFRLSWKSLFLTDVAFKTVAFVLLTPLVGALFRGLIAMSGSAVLTDQDILYFLLGPVGWGCLILVGALWLAIAALEQASLMGILCAAADGRRLGVRVALDFARGRALPVLKVAARVVGLTLAVSAPFLATAGGVYLALLTDYDINFYLAERPPAFLAAVAIGGVVATALAALLLYLFSGWLFALPLVLFENVPANRALRASAKRAAGRRRVVFGFLACWFLAMSALSAVATFLIGAVATWIVPEATGSLELLALVIGLVVLFWGVVSLAVNLLGTTTLAVILFGLYQEVSGKSELDLWKGSLPEEDLSGRPRVTRKRLWAACTVGVAVAAGIGAVALHTVRLDDDVQIMAHRGSSKAAPENTMAAVLRAIDDGADYVEIDVQETADGEVVVFHDSDFMRVAGVNLKLWDATMDDLDDIDIGSFFSPEFADQRVPTLADVLDACKDKIRVNIELKFYGHDDQLERRVAHLVDAREMGADVVVMSLETKMVRTMKTLRPDWRVGQVTAVSAGRINRIDADFLAVSATMATRRLIREAHGNGKEVFVWTVDDAPTMSVMMGRGVDAILTNKPALAISVREQRAQLSPPERLLLELAVLLGNKPEIGEQ